MSSDHNAPPILSADNPLMPRLYQAAIGPLQTTYYQQQFERFDALGKPLASWNWAAGCCTLGWMALRGLWRYAAVYAGVLLAVVALWWALGLNQLLPRPAALALALLLLLVAVLVPGMGGNALYHRTVRNRTMQALTQSRTLGEAMTQLETQAPTPARLQWATTGGALCWLVAAALAWGVSTLSAPSERPAHSGPTQQDTARALAALAPAKTPAASALPEAAPAAPVGAEAKPAAAAPEASTATVAAETASAPDLPSLTPLAAPAAAVAGAVGNAALASGHSVDGGNKSEPATAATPAPVPAAPPTSAEHQPSPPEKASKIAKSERAKDKAREKVAADKSADKNSSKADKAKSEKAKAADKTSDKAEPATARKTALQPGKYYLNSGIYAQADNAKRVTRQLRAAGQPVFTQTLEGRNGEVTRIRVGPFDSRAQAEAAASKIQALKLEAQLLHYAPN